MAVLFGILMLFAGQPEHVTISGRVVDKDGNGIPGVLMTLRPYGDTNQDGRVDMRDYALWQQGAPAEVCEGCPTTLREQWALRIGNLRGPTFTGGR